MSRIRRTDKEVFKTKEEAIEFGIKEKLLNYKIYVSKDGIYTVKQYTKCPEDNAVGYLRLVDGKIVYSDKIPPQKINAPKSYRKGTRVIDGIKFKNYICDNGIDKRYLCDLVHKSRAFINDVIRYNRVDILCFERIMDYLHLPDDYFDVKEPVVEKVPEEIEESQDDVKTLNDIHDDLMCLIASNKRLEALMKTMIDMWRND